MQLAIYTFVFAASGPNAISSGLGINGWAFLSQLITFGVVFFILWRYAFPLVLRTLERRETTIREGVENAEKAKRDLADAGKQSDRILADARREAQAIIERAQKSAQQEADRIVEDAHTKAQQIGQQQSDRIQQEASRARNELSRLVVNLSIDASERVIGRSVNSDDNRRLVQEFVTASGNTREQ
ncbi:MAG: hypothetical protein NVS4B11_02660 [Ktedonobacteraceae bacterium]